MSENSSPDLLGIQNFPTKETETRSLYLDLAQAILRSQRNTTLVQEWVISDNLDNVNKQEHLETLTDSTLRLLVRIHNQMAEENRYSDDKRSLIFDTQEQVDSVWEKGLTALSPQQARAALQEITNETNSIDVLHQLNDYATNRINEALNNKDVKNYMIWWNLRKVTDAHWVVSSSRYITGNHDRIATVDELVKMIENENVQINIPEVKAFNRLSKIINSIPEDPTRARIAMIRMPKEVDPDRRVRVLIDFPPNTFKDNGGKYLHADKNRRVFYSGQEAPLCVQDSFFQFYQLIVDKRSNENQPRAAYLTPYVAEGVEGIVNFPEEAKHFIQISFADGTPSIPDPNNITADFPGVFYSRKDAIDNTDLDRVVVSDDGLSHFIIGYDENGNPIRQNTVQYSLQAIMSGFSNVANIPVEKLMK